MNELLLCNLLRFLGWLFCLLPAQINLMIANFIGFVGYLLMTKKRNVVKANLRIVFKDKTQKEINHIARRTFQNFAASFMDLLLLPRIKQQGIEKTVQVVGKEYLDEAFKHNKGCIILAIHSGSWELASFVGSMCGRPYNVVANEQSKAPKLNEMLNEYRRLAGAKVIPPGSATRDIIRALQNNEIVSLVLDQGGKEGLTVDFFGRTASMSTGAIRLALKYGTPICPVWIERNENFKHTLTASPPEILTSTGDVEKDVALHTQRFTKHFENLLKKNPNENMWFYKVYKYSTQKEVLILDDGKVGHLRQSQAVLESIKEKLLHENKAPIVSTALINFKSSFHQKLFVLFTIKAQLIGFLRHYKYLALFLTRTSYRQLAHQSPDFIVSCGSKTEGINFILSKSISIKSIHVLKPSFIFAKRFGLNIIPQHDNRKHGDHQKTLVTSLALNLINPKYLKSQEALIVQRFPQINKSVRFRIGVLLGGDTKGVKYDLGQIKFLIHKIKEASEYFNCEILLTSSRRTPKEIDEMLVKELKNFDRCSLLVIANDQNIPEAIGGILALSDLLIVSGESISMVSEAVASKKRVVVFSPQGNYEGNGDSKYDQFVINLHNQGCLLASSIKDITQAITQMMNQKIVTKSIDDQGLIVNAIKGM